jgi:PKD repeat protein
MFRYFLLFLSIYPLTSLAQPAHDNPCNATPLNAGSSCSFVSSTNVGATSSPGIPAPGCGNYVNNDVWFSIVVPSGGALLINSNTGSMTDGAMAAYSGTCSSLVLIACDDDSSPNGAMPQLSLNGLTPGSTIFIRFWRYGGGTGTFSICAVAPEPAPPCGTSPAAGNTCATATPICDLNGYCGNTSASYTANSWSQSCGFLGLSNCGLTGEFCGSIENNSFLSFVASGTSISFDVWVTSSTLGYGIQIFIFSASGGCSGTVTQYGPCYNPGVVEPGPVNITAGGLTPGNTYYIMIDGNAGDVCNYTIGANSGVLLPVSVSPESTILCPGENVLLTAAGGNGTYNWNSSPHLNTTSGSTVTATPPGPGTYTYTVNSTAGNPNCPASSSATATVTMNDCGCAITAQNSGNVCVGGTTDLTVTSLGGATWNWTGPDGFSSTSQNPMGINLPTSPGSYTYTVTATLGGQICSSSTDVVVNALPSVNGGADVTICEGESVLLTATGATTYSWDPVISNGVAFVPASSGAYTVTGTSAEGCVATDVVNVSVNTCGCIVTASTVNTICSGEMIDLMATNVVGATWSWSGPSSFTSAVQNVTGVFPPSISGIYTYTVTASTPNGNCSSSVNVEVHDLPIIDAGPNIAICAGESVTLTAQGAQSYSWSPSAVNGISFIPVATQLFTVTGTDSNGCENQDQVQVTVNPIPLVNAGDDQSICEGSSVTLSALGATSYTWNNGVVNASPFSPSSTMTYTVTGTLNGCTSNDDVTIFVVSAPSVNFNADVLSGCSPLEVNFTSQVSQGSSCTWNFGNGQTSQSCDNVQMTFSQPGCYDISLTAINSGCTSSFIATNYICVENQPIAGFEPSSGQLSSLNTSVQFVNTSNGAANYIWSFGDGSNPETSIFAIS